MRSLHIILLSILTTLIVIFMPSWLCPWAIYIFALIPAAFLT